MPAHATPRTNWEEPSALREREASTVALVLAEGLHLAAPVPLEVPRNDTCPELPEIPNGWKSPSQPELVHGTVVTYQCYPGYQVVGSSVLMCQWDLTWSEDLPSCQRVTSCHDPGDVEHSRRLISSPKFPVGATVQYICDQGFVLTGSAILTCHDRQASSPKWSDRAPKCLCKCQMGRKKPLVGDKRCCP